jgi:hypothetical protein
MYSKEYYSKNREKWKKWNADSNRKRLENEKHLRVLYPHRFIGSMDSRYRMYKRQAEDRGIFWNINREEFSSFWKEPCFYCGEDILSIGLDRLNNEKEYSIDNVVPCCKKCNFMKSNMGFEEFIGRCQFIGRRFKEST